MTTLPPIYVGDEPENTGVSMEPANPAAEVPGVNFSPPQPLTTLPPAVAIKRAEKLQAGVGKYLNKTTEEVFQGINDGRENAMRDEAAAAIRQQQSEQKMQMIRNLAIQKGGPLDENEVRRILDPYNPLNKPISSSDIVEKHYGLNYVSSLDSAISLFKDGPVAKAKEEIPEDVNYAFLKGSDLTAKMELVNKTAEDLEARRRSSSIVSQGLDMAKNLFQPYIEAKMRGQNPNVGFLDGILLGENLRNQADELMGVVDYEDFSKRFRGIVDNIAKDNIPLAEKFVEYVSGVAKSDRYAENLFSAITPFDYLGIAKGAKNVANATSLSRRANKAVEQYVKQATEVGTDVAKRAEAAGDVDTAAAERSSKITMSRLDGSGNPVEVATDDTLLTFMNQDKDKLATNTGNLRREQVTRIQDQFDASGKSLLTRIVEAARINRIPMALATKNAVNIVKESIKEFFPGVRNAILDVSDPIYEPRSNTFWHDVTFGNFGGYLFSNEKTAKNFAKLHGWDDVMVVESHGPIANKQMQELLDKGQKLRKDVADAEHGITTNKSRMNDASATDEYRAKAKEQHDLFEAFRKEKQRDLDEVNLRMKSNETYDRVAGLESDINRLRLENKERMTNLKKVKDPTDEMKNIVKMMNDANMKSVQEKIQEIRALKSGKAETISRPTTVEQHGAGFKIVVRTPLRETDNAVRDLLTKDVNGNPIASALSTNSATGWKGLMNAAIGKFRGADDTLALNESINRKIGTYTQSLFKEWANQEAKYLREISTGVVRTDPVTGETIPYWKAKPVALWNKVTGNQSEVYGEFVRALDYARDARDPITGQIGYFFQTPGELNDYYLRVNRREASFTEHQAYFAFVRMVEGDRIMRELSEFRNRARLGVEQFQLKMRGPQSRFFVESGYFDGRQLKKFPGGDDVMLVMGRRQNEEFVVNLGGGGLSPRQLEQFRQDVEQGRRIVIEVYASEHTPLRNFSEKAGNEHVRYILTESADRKPIEFNHVNRRGGGHFEYDYEHFIKQPNMYHQYENVGGVKGAYKSVYVGDNTFMPVLNRAMGQDLVDKINTVRKLIKEGKVDEAKNYTLDNLPMEWEELYGMFKARRDEAGKTIPAQFSLNEKFYLTDKNRDVIDMTKDLEEKYGNSLKISAKQGSLNRQFQVAYNTERESFGLRHVEDVGTQGNPVYRYAPEAKMVDPIATMNRSLNRIVNTTFMDDYKIYAVEHWLREAEEHLKALPSEIQASPFYYFVNSKDKSAFKAGTPWETIQNLLGNRYKIEQFVGVPNTFDTALHSAKQALVDWSYRKFGPEESRNLLQKSITILPNWMLAHATDPVTFLRSMTFHEKLGIFNPAQWLVQAQTFATILSVSPLHGTAGTYAAFLHAWASINGNKQILEALDRYATKLNVFGQSQWRPGEFLEAKKALDRVGFEKVAGEYANLNTALKTDFIGNDFKSFLNAGTYFFRKGEQSARVGAWYTAFREFRHANPSGPITNADLGKILQRADLLTVNMSRASNSMLNSSVLSLTTQFLTYQMRLAELFLGKRLGETTMERNMARFRMVAFYSALYGAPSAIGVTGLPMAQSIRQEAIERGYNLGENWITTAIDQGIPAVALALITGKGDFYKGNNYNVGARLGSPGFTQFYDALKSDAPWYQLLAGASGTVLLNQMSSMGNFFKAMSAMAFRPNGEKPFPLVLDDFVDMFKEISTVNQAWKIYAAINTGKWMSKNEGYIGDVSKWNAAFMATLGLSPQQQEDSYIKADIRKQDIAFQKHALKEFIKEYRRGIQDTKDNNQSEAQKHFKRAFTLLEIAGYPPEKKGTAMALAAKGYESMIRDQDYQFMFKNVPTSKSTFLGIPTPFTTQSNVREVRRDQFRTQGQIDQYKGQP